MLSQEHAPAAAATRIRAAVDELVDALLEATRQPAAPIDQLLDVEAAADRLGISRTTAYGLIGDGRLRSVRVGRRRLVPTSAIAELVDGD